MSRLVAAGARGIGCNPGARLRSARSGLAQPRNRADPPLLAGTTIGGDLTVHAERLGGADGTPEVEAPTMADKVKDPVCGMEIDPSDAVAHETHDGHDFYFCSAGCHQAFLKDPHQFGHPGA